MAKAKQQPLDPAKRAEILGLTVQLAAASGEDALVIARAFEDWLGAAGEHGSVALRAAVAEAADRHEHLRGRHPSNSAAVLERAERYAGYIAGQGALV